MTATPSPLKDIPWDDPAAMEAWVIATRNVAPSAAEQFLADNDFEPICELPTTGGTKCNLWKPKGRNKFPDLTHIGVTVYHSKVISRAGVVAIVTAIRMYRQWKAMLGNDL